MRRLGFLIVAMLPAMALAEPVVLRVEAKRGPDTAAVVEGWAARFPEVVTFPLAGGWTGIGLGPMEREAADAEMARLKRARQIPADSFIVPVPGGAVPATSAAPDAAQAPAAPRATAALSPEATGADGGSARISVVDTAPAATQGEYIRLQRQDSRDAADEALNAWREDFPEAGLWRQADGGFVVALGPVDAEAGADWLSAFRAAERVGRFAAVIPAAELGEALVPGGDPDLPPAGSAEMPPLDEVQRALRWAGRYDGRIDGLDGPQTRAAIAAEVLASRAAPDAASAMQALVDRRASWRAAMDLQPLTDAQSGLTLLAPMDRIEFQRNEQGLSIYGPKDGSGAALILYGASGGQQEMLDFAGLVTALGWVPSPDRRVSQGHVALLGRNDTHIGQAEARVENGRVLGVVLIWPVMDAEDQPRVAAEILDSLRATGPETAPGPGDDSAVTAGQAPRQTP